MSNSLLNCFISAFVGMISAVGTVWFLSARSATNEASDSSAVATGADRLEVGSLVVRENILLVDAETNEPTLELKNGSVFAQNGIYGEHVGAYRILGQKLQATPENPLDAQSPVFGELSVNEDGGAYMALLSPRESHSLTFGFDRNEKGCVVSQNNDDRSMVAQAIFLKPSAEDAAKEQASAEAPQAAPEAQTAATTPAAEPTAAPDAAEPAEKTAEAATDAATNKG